ncbi:MAG: T9SS type A sorting domain-containing protein [Chitinophagales bacterium]|nr:T9SS type A sorting domain-containing protein [Chitinophagales bacterium]
MKRHKRTLAPGGVFPNPAQSEVSISSKGFDLIEIEISDVLGRVVTRTNGAFGCTSVVLDVSHFAAGLYNVTIRGNDFTASSKLVVQ